MSEQVGPVVILGSTGSIGTQALDVLSRCAPHVGVEALAAGGNNLGLLASQAAATGARVVGVATGSAAQVRAAIEAAEDAAGLPRVEREILVGPHAAADVAACRPDGVVLNGMSGSIGLGPTLAALEAGADLALANKESLVAGAALVRRASRRPGQIRPVDSEHSAMWQALAAGKHRRGLVAQSVDGSSEVARLILTASGGPFRGRSRAELANVSAQQALNHPTWDMGPVVTINSSTLMNKALELIEAHVLFDVAPERITAVVHPQSVIHSAVEFVDGSTIAQASPPDMCLPIALGLSAPQRWAGAAAPCAWDAPVSWTFEPLDEVTFPAVRLARQAVAASSTHPAVFNAANEEAVDAFLSGRCGYLEIVDTVQAVLEAWEHPGEPRDLADVTEVERHARAAARERLQRNSTSLA
ncbi:1-deoxy-D-xylulose-5-phosphate reductoisomerase [Buchananella felis]|uniref:1-deoxy-D-xylulose-5-phosphate reductoisomerase n=1 Tax=Buchananella felis TaxID=3231492 RepID=UPI003528085F